MSMSPSNVRSPSRHFLSPSSQPLHVTTDNRSDLASCPPNTAMKTLQSTAESQKKLPIQRPRPTGPTIQWSEAYAPHRLVLRTLNLQKTLLNCRVDIDNRALMVDWMFEVLFTLQKNFIFATFFRAISILDFYLKHSLSGPTNEDLHLLGVTSMYISSKFEDQYPLNMVHFVRDACQGKFTPCDIRATEHAILQTFEFSIAFKHPGEILDHYAFLVFGVDPDVKELVDKARSFLIQCLFNVRFNDYEIKFLVITCLLLAGYYMEKWGRAQREPEAGEFWGKSHRLLNVFIHCEIVEGRVPQEIHLLVAAVRRYLVRVCPNLNLCNHIQKFVAFNEKFLN